MCTLYTYTNTYMPRFSPSGFFRPSRCLIPTPGLTSEYPICAVCVCVCVYTHLHPHTLPPALTIEKTQTTPLAHDAVAAAVSHKHHSIIRVGAGLIQFVSRSHSRFTSSRILFPLFFRVSFNTSPDFCRHNMRKGKRAKEKGPCSRLARV